LKLPKKNINNKQQTLVRYAETMRNALLFNLKFRTMAKIEIEVTKIQKILIERGLTQTDLYELIKSNGNEIGKDRINRIVNGKLTNFHTNTAKILSNALGVKIDDIVE
jgi:DNA-binding Xre family transcriptional regulator